MAECRYCHAQGEWRQTQWGNRMFVNGEQHRCEQYRKSKGFGGGGSWQSGGQQVQQQQQPQQQYKNVNYKSLTTYDTQGRLEVLERRLDGLEKQLATLAMQFEGLMIRQKDFENTINERPPVVRNESKQGKDPVIPQGVPKIDAGTDPDLIQNYVREPAEQEY